LKPLDPQAAIGRQQMKKLPSFIQARKDNWQCLRAALADLEEFFQFQLPTHATEWLGPCNMQNGECEIRNVGMPSSFILHPSSFSWDRSGHRSDPSWFGFMMLVRKTAPFTRREFIEHLDGAKIGNRMLFGGNLVRQPAFVTLLQQSPGAFRVVGDLAGADRIMNEAVFVGTYPGLSAENLAYIVKTIRSFVAGKTGKHF
jgi:CDP-6-deoxy-D-xylo-4-hexulose-3-dehydrase